MKTGRRPAASATARILCAVAAWALPRGTRRRYLDEWRADLDFAPDQALAYAASVLGQVIALRLALTGGQPTHRPVLCRMRLHHDVSIHDNPEDRRLVSRVCTRCGRVRDDWTEPANGVNDGIAWGASQTIH